MPDTLINGDQDVKEGIATPPLHVHSFPRGAIAHAKDVLTTAHAVQSTTYLTETTHWGSLEE